MWITVTGLTLFIIELFNWLDQHSFSEIKEQLNKKISGIWYSIFCLHCNEGSDICIPWTVASHRASTPFSKNITVLGDHYVQLYYQILPCYTCDHIYQTRYCCWLQSCHGELFSDPDSFLQIKMFQFQQGEISWLKCRDRIIAVLIHVTEGGKILINLWREKVRCF